jgi:hypothetical protein
MRDRVTEPDVQDQRLGLASLGTGILIVAIGLGYRLFPAARHVVGGEALYGLNRLHMLASGYRPYTGFEYAYGPLHLYGPAILVRLFGRSIIGGYYLWWVAEWMVGTVMLWSIFKVIDIPLARRRLLFGVTLGLQLPAILNEGIAYTPTRMFGTAFFVAIVALTWNRSKLPAVTICVAACAVVAAFGISPEQGISLSGGLLLWFLLLAVYGDGRFSLGAAAAFAALIGTAIVFFWRIGEFSTMRGFSKGGMAFPLLPSPSNVLVLLSYVAAAVLGIRTLVLRRTDSMVLPLFLSGFALLPAAMGRCDLGHLMIASPAWLVGVGLIESRPPLRQWWSGLVATFILLPLFVFASISSVRHQRLALTRSTPLDGFPAEWFSPYRQPCMREYRAVTVAARPTDRSEDDCLEPGRYFRTVNMVTSDEMDLMLKDLDRRPLKPLLLLDRPLEDQFRSTEDDLPLLYLLEVSPWVPKARHPLLRFQKLIDWVELNYAPAPNPTGIYRVWYPMPAEAGGRHTDRRSSAP